MDSTSTSASSEVGEKRRVSRVGIGQRRGSSSRWESGSSRDRERVRSCRDLWPHEQISCKSCSRAAEKQVCILSKLHMNIHQLYFALCQLYISSNKWFMVQEKLFSELSAEKDSGHERATRTDDWCADITTTKSCHPEWEPLYWCSCTSHKDIEKLCCRQEPQNCMNNMASMH